VIGQLDFQALDGLAFAAARGRLGNQIPVLSAQELGPLVELHQLAASGLLPPPHQCPWLAPAELAGLIHALAEGRREWLCPNGRQLGLLRTGSTSPTDTIVWTKFGLAAQQAASAAGFPRMVAAQLSAAAGELYSNIYEHSGAASTGLIAFLATPGSFEFAVCDSGVGVLASLRSCPEYRTLADAGAALQFAISDGVSRHGSGAHRGHGFRPLFVGLANLKSLLRFRSGDHVLTIDGTIAGSMPSRPAQKPSARGLLISVRCEL